MVPHVFHPADLKTHASPDLSECERRRPKANKCLFGACVTEGLVVSQDCTEGCCVLSIALFFRGCSGCLGASFFVAVYRDVIMSRLALYARGP